MGGFNGIVTGCPFNFTQTVKASFPTFSLVAPAGSALISLGTVTGIGTIHLLPKKAPTVLRYPSEALALKKPWLSPFSFHEGVGCASERDIYVWRVSLFEDTASDGYRFPSGKSPFRESEEVILDDTGDGLVRTLI